MVEKKHHELVKSFGKAVRFYRNKLGFSQEALADRAQLDRSYMSQIERGIKNATLNSIWRIAQALEVAPSNLLRLTEELAGLGRPAEPPPASALPLVAATKGAVGEPSLGQSAGTVLIVDDDQEICSMVANILHEDGYRARAATCGFDAFWVVATEPVHVVVSDVRMNNGSGLELLSAMQKHFPRIPVMLFSGYDDLTHEDAVRLGATGLISKPFEPVQFLGLIKETIANAAARQLGT